MKMSEFEFEGNGSPHQGMKWTFREPSRQCVIMHGNAVKQLFIDAGRPEVDMSDIDDEAVYRVEGGKVYPWGDA